MKSGLLNLCNLNTVLMLVILGLVIYCCVNQSKEKFSALQGSAFPNVGNCEQRVEGRYEVCNSSEGQVGGPTPGEMREYEYKLARRFLGLTEEQITNLSEEELSSALTNALNKNQLNELVTQAALNRNSNAEADNDLGKRAEKGERNMLIQRYLDAESDYLASYPTQSGQSIDDLRTALRAGDLPVLQNNDGNNIPQPAPGDYEFRNESQSFIKNSALDPSNLDYQLYPDSEVNTL